LDMNRNPSTDNVEIVFFDKFVDSDYPFAASTVISRYLT